MVITTRTSTCPVIYQMLLFLLVYVVAYVIAGSPCPEDRALIYPCSCHEIPDKGNKVSKHFTLLVCKGIRHAGDLNVIIQQGINRMVIDRMEVIDSNVTTKAEYKYNVPEESVVAVDQVSSCVYKNGYNGKRICTVRIRERALLQNWGVYIRELFFFNTSQTNDFLTSITTWDGFYKNLKNLRMTKDDSWKGIPLATQEPNYHHHYGNSRSATKRLKLWNMFSNFTNMEHLALVEVFLEEIPVFPAELPWNSHLKSLDLSSNQLKGFLPGTFSNLTSLQYLKLTNNWLKALNRNVFGDSGLGSLVELDLSWNPLTHLPRDFFLGMYSLRKLNLKGTLLQTLHRQTVELSRNALKLVDLRDAFLECGCELSWMAANSNNSLKIEVKGQCKNPVSAEFKEAKDSSLYKNCP